MIDRDALPKLVAPDENDPRIQAAIEELRNLVLLHYPSATFEVALSEDAEGIRLTATIDIENVEEVYDLVSPHEVVLLVERGLPVAVRVEWPEARLRAYLKSQRAMPHARHATSVAD